MQHAVVVRNQVLLRKTSASFLQARQSGGARGDTVYGGEGAGGQITGVT